MTKELPIPYANDEEFKKDLRRVLQEDYGVSLSAKELDEAGENIKKFLDCFL